MKKQNIILALLVVVLIWLAILTWWIFAQEQKIDLHEFWIRTALDMAK